LQVTFSDFGVCNITSESSLHDLNNRLTNPVDMGNFRPSIVVKGSVAFDEVNIHNVNYTNLIYIYIYLSVHGQMLSIEHKGLIQRLLIFYC
jgi:hypothetical protein